MNRPLLVDTCAALWIVADELSDAGTRALADVWASGLSVFVSPITAWEIGVLARKGRFRSQYSPQRWFEQLMRVPGFALGEMTPKVLMESSLLPEFKCGDPADRIIAATAREYGFTVLTRDRSLLDYAGQGYLSALEC